MRPPPDVARVFRRLAGDGGLLLAAGIGLLVARLRHGLLHLATLCLIGLLLRLGIGRLGRGVWLALLALPVLGLRILRLAVLWRLRLGGLVLAVLLVLPILAGLLLPLPILTGWLLVLGLAFAVLALAILVVLLLTLARRIDRRAISDGILLIRVLLERTVVGRDRGVVLALSRQRIAEVVQPSSVGTASNAFCAAAKSPLRYACTPASRRCCCT